VEKLLTKIEARADEAQRARSAAAAERRTARDAAKRAQPPR